MAIGFLEILFGFVASTKVFAKVSRSYEIA